MRGGRGVRGGKGVGVHYRGIDCSILVCWCIWEQEEI